jgi:hypothetical protein
MTQDLETILRKSLDEADRSIKIMLPIFVIELAGVVAGVLWVDHLSKTSDVKTMLLISLVVIVLAQANSLLLSCVFVTAMTRKTLKAIDLLSKE